MTKTIIIIFSLLTAFLLFAYLWNDPLWSVHTDDFNLDKIHGFFETFGALATAAVLFIVLEQTRIARADLISKNDSIVYVGIQSVDVLLMNMETADASLCFVFLNGQEKKEFAFSVENRGPALARSVKVRAYDLEFDFSSLQVGDKKERYFPDDFLQSVKNLVIGIPSDIEQLNVDHFFL